MTVEKLLVRNCDCVLKYSYLGTSLRLHCVADISKALYLKNRILEEETKNSLLLWCIHGLPCYVAYYIMYVHEHGWKLTLGQPHGTCKGTHKTPTRYINM